jgi:hypothetical protein
MCQCLRRCGLLIAHQVSLYHRIRTYQPVYTNSYFFIELWYRICIYQLLGTNRQKRQLFVMAVHTPSGRTLPGNLAIIPSEQLWVFHAIYQYAFPHLYSSEVCSRNRLELTDKDEAEYRSFEALIELQVILSSQQLCCVPFMVCEWLLRRIYSLCLKTVIVETFMVSWFIVV